MKKKIKIIIITPRGRLLSAKVYALKSSVMSGRIITKNKYF